MKRTILVTFVFLSLFVLYGSEPDIKPNLISPGEPGNATIVEQACPTFSWTSVPWAAAYKIAVFRSGTGSVLSYEEISATETPVINKEIRGRATSWTPSSIQRMNTGTNYIWFVQAVDENGAGQWSAGGSFSVNIPVVLSGIEERLREKLKDRGLSDETLDEVFIELKKEIREVVLVDKNMSGTSTGPVGVLGSENIGAANVYYGELAGFSLVTTGGVAAEGVYNSFFGHSAGTNTTTGDLNTFLGTNSGVSNTTGQYNTFSGAESGYSNTTGNSNTFSGYRAGFSNTTGLLNTYIGVNSGLSNVTGTYNTFLGHESGKAATDGPNTFIGFQSGYKTTTGFSNVFMGLESGWNNTTGQMNVFIGDFCGKLNAIGSYNTVVGYHSGNQNTSGIRNTFFGSYAGNSNTTGSGNLFLGYYAGSDETGSNKLYIETDYSSRATPLIYGEFDNDIVTIHGKLGIGTKTPIFPLEVHTTGSNAKIVINRTDGATGHFLSKTDFCTFGTASNHPLRLNVNNIPKVFLLTNGNLGLGVTTPVHPLHLANGAHCTSGGVWTNGSSRELKENIISIKSKEAFEALEVLEPVFFNYKLEKGELYAGFIAEDVPEIVASKGRVSLAAMDIVAVLTKVVKEQQKAMKEQQRINTELLKRLDTLEKK